MAVSGVSEVWNSDPVIDCIACKGRLISDPLVFQEQLMFQVKSNGFHIAQAL